MKKLPVTILALVGVAVAAVAAWYVQREPSSAQAVGQAASAGPGGPGGQAGPGTGGPGASSGAGPGAGAGGAAKGQGGGGGGPGGQGGPGGPAAVEVGKAAAMRVEEDVLAVGSLRARRSVMLRPEVSGRIAVLNFSDGARVTKGQLLLQLDDTLQQAQLQQAQAQAAIARTNLQRSRELAAQNFVSQSAVDQNAAALEVAASQVALAQAQLQRLRVLAPFDAVTGIRVVNVGDYLKDGADVVTLDDVGLIYLDFKLPEKYVPQVRKGSLIEAQVDALPNSKFAGQVVALDSQIDSNGRALLVRAELRNPQGNLRPGMFARARLVFGVRERAVLVPEEALTPLAGKQFIYKVVKGANGPVTQRVEAKMGVRLPGKVEILEGLVDGDIVVTAGQPRLARGDSIPVRVVDIDKPGTGRPPGGAGRPAAASGAAAGSAAASKPQRTAP